MCLYVYAYLGVSLLLLIHGGGCVCVCVCVFVCVCVCLLGCWCVCCFKGMWRFVSSLFVMWRTVCSSTPIPGCGCLGEKSGGEILASFSSSCYLSLAPPPRYPL